MHQNITNYQYSNRKHRKTSTILHQHHKNIWHNMLLSFLLLPPIFIVLLGVHKGSPSPTLCRNENLLTETPWPKLQLEWTWWNWPRLSTGAIKILVSTHLKNMLVKLDHFPRWGWKYKMFELPLPRNSKFQFLVQTSRVDTPVTSW